jgi:hypothetical protein
MQVQQLIDDLKPATNSVFQIGNDVYLELAGLAIAIKSDLSIWSQGKKLFQAPNITQAEAFIASLAIQ